MFYQVNDLFRFQRPVVKIQIKHIYQDRDQYQKAVNEAKALLSPAGLDELAQVGIKYLIDRTIERSYDIGQFQMKSGGSEQDLLEAYMPLVRTSLKTIHKVTNGKYGFADSEALDQIRIAPKPRSAKESRRAAREMRELVGEGAPLTTKEPSAGRGSPYNIAWMIAEFGTGRFAYPERRMPGDPSDYGTKVPGGSGEWYFSKPGRAGPISLGQEGAHFLFGERKTTEEVRKDIDNIVKLLAATIESRLGLK